MFRKAFRDIRGTALWYAVGVAAYGFVIALFWPVVEENEQILQQLIAVFPESLKNAFGITGDTGFVPFISQEHLSFMLPLILSIFAIMSGAAAVAQEVERGTVELWLSVPERRWRLLAAKWAALICGVLIVVAGTLAGIVLGALVVGEELGASGLAALAALITLFCGAIGGYAMLLSVMSSERARAAGLAAALTLASYLAGVVAGLDEQWKWLANLSLLSAYRPQDALAKGTIAPEHLAALGLVAIVSSVLALVLFERRDATI